MEKNIEIIGLAVTNRVTVTSKLGAKVYSVSELMELNESSLDQLYIGVKSQTEMYEKSLLKKGSMPERLKQQLDLLEAIVNVKSDLQVKANKAKIDRDRASSRYSLLISAKNKQEVKDISKMSQEQIDSEIDELLGII